MITSIALLDWLALPLSGAADHGIAPWASWHARCMVLAWALLLPLGALAARFFKVLPAQGWPNRLDNKAWWHAHRALQWGGVVVMVVGLVVAFGQGARAAVPNSLHAWAGWALVALALLQVAGGLARGSKGGPTDALLRGDHYDMTPWRVFFERLHKSLGWLVLAASVPLVVLGLVIADAPRWMLLLLVLWWAALVLAFVVLQRQGRCIDTYQAIWGPDARHPGNRVAPIGWGVRRPLDEGHA